MQHVVGVAVFGALGSLARHGATLAAQRWLGDAFPWGTLAVNLLGSALLGVVWELAARSGLPEGARLALGTGFLGGFTTFSTFSVETVRLLEAGRYGAAAGSAAGNLGLGLVAAALGMAAVRAWT